MASNKYDAYLQLWWNKYSAHLLTHLVDATVSKYAPYYFAVIFMRFVKIHENKNVMQKRMQNIITSVFFSLHFIFFITYIKQKKIKHKTYKKQKTKKSKQTNNDMLFYIMFMSCFVDYG